MNTSAVRRKAGRKDGQVPLPGDPAMRSMAGYAPSIAAMNAFRAQDLTGMASQAVIVHGLDAGMRLVTFVAIEPSHGNLLRERCPQGRTVAGQAPFPVGNEHPRLLWRERVAHGAGCLLHADPVDLPVLVTSQAGGFIGMERMHRPLVAIPARKLLDIDVAGMAR